MTDTDRTDRSARIVDRQWLASARYYATVQGAFSLLVAVGMSVLLGVVVLAVHLFGTPGQSFLQYTTQVQWWFVLGVSVWCVYAGINTLVPAGATRGSVRSGVLLAAPVAGLVASAVSTFTLWLESLVYGWAGWSHVAGRTDGVVDPGAWADGWIALGATRFLLFLAAALAGVLVGAAFYRFGQERGVIAVVLLPLTLLPMLAVSVVVESSVVGIDVIGLLPFGSSGVLTRLGVTAGAVVYTVVGLRLLLHDVPVRSRPA